MDNSLIGLYPRDDTPGCTTEGQQFRDLHADFQQAKVPVFGISRDSVASHERLLSDPEENVCGVFGVMKMKNMYGRAVPGVERSI